MEGYLTNIVGGTDTGAWDSGASYVRKEVCTSGGRRWLCLAPHTNSQPPSQYWRLYLDPDAAGEPLTLSEVYPVGCIYTSTVSTNPATVFGMGTWSAFGAGRVLVGLDSGQTEFDTVEETGGAKTHTLTTGEMPSHTHIQDAHTHTQNSHNHTQDPHSHGMAEGTTDGSGNFMDRSNAAAAASATTDAATATNQATTATNQNTTATNQNTGGGSPHNNLQPYIVVYFFKRTA